MPANNFDGIDVKSLQPEKVSRNISPAGAPEIPVNNFDGMDVILYAPAKLFLNKGCEPSGNVGNIPPKVPSIACKARFALSYETLKTESVPYAVARPVSFMV